MSRSQSPPSSSQPRRFPVDGVLLGMTLAMAVAFNPAVASWFSGTAQAKTAAVRTAAVAMPGAVTSGGGPIRVSATLDRSSVLVGRDGEVRAELVIEADAEAATVERRDTDLVVILDRSGSMRGDKITYARAAVRELVGQLDGSDRFALVTYSDDAKQTIALGTATAAAKRSWISTIDGVQANGYTNMSGGMDLALDLVEGQRLPGRAARVVLISDGLPNLGDPSPEGLVRRAQRAPRGDYVLTAVGVGEDFNEFLMSSLADAGTGNYHFLANGGNLAKVFANELSTARTTVASGVAVAIAAQPGVRIVDASGYPLEAQKDGSVIFRPGILFAGQQRRIWVTYQVRPDSTGSIPLGAISMSWSRNGARHSASLSNEPSVTVVKDEKQYYTDFDEESWERSVVTEEWNKTRQDVSRAVSAGKKEKAVGILREYRAKNSAANAYIGSGAVSDNLDDAAALEAEVEETFIGEDQRDKQNVFSKSQSEDAYKSRRVGQLKQ